MYKYICVNTFNMYLQVFVQTCVYIHPQLSNIVADRSVQPGDYIGWVYQYLVSNSRSDKRNGHHTSSTGNFGPVANHIYNYKSIV